MENLKPQFVPGQAMGSSAVSMTMEDKIAQLQISKENDELKVRVRDRQSWNFWYY